MKMDTKFDEDMEMDEMHKHDKKDWVMTPDDVAKELSKDFADEISDSKKYHRMAKVMEKAGDHDDCHYLTEMAKDEYTHAYFIYNFMVDHDMHIPEEQEKDFKELKEKMGKYFR